MIPSHINEQAPGFILEELIVKLRDHILDFRKFSP